MIRVTKVAPEDPVWQKIFSEASAEKATIVKQFENVGKVKVNDDLYKKYMRFLLAIFNRKCAYCETDIGSNQPGDVEHYRPKGRVADENFKPIKVKHPKWGEVQHPGYFWLAYDWDNLLPSCIDCNRYRHHGTGVEDGAGKADRFPVDGFRASAPGEECHEKALLIRPDEDDPEQHLIFLDTGEFKAKTPMGEQTLIHLGLNRREPLVKARKFAFKNAHALLIQYFTAVISKSEDLEELRNRINEIWDGKEPYTAMQRLAFRFLQSHMKDNGLDISFPLQPPEPKG